MNKKLVIYDYVVEKMIENSDLRESKITNDRAKHVLAYCFKIPRWLQSAVINEMVRLNYLERENQTTIAVNSKKKGILS